MHPLQLKLQREIRRCSVTDPDTGCWLWNRQVSNSGYGRMMISNGGQTLHESAHRISYLAYVGPLKRDDIVRQRCGNRLCVNPDHLILASERQEGAVA